MAYTGLIGLKCKRMVFKCKRNIPLRYYALTGAVVVLGIAVPLIVINWSLKPKPKVIYHGPNPATIPTDAASNSTLDKISPSPVSSTSTEKPQIQTKNLQEKKGKEYGIAAGSGLTSLNQRHLDHYFNYLQSLGAKWVRWDINWGAVQPDNSSSYQWGDVDRVAATAKRYSINSLGIITYTPKWAADQSCSASFGCAPANPQEFGRFAGEVALRYKDLITYWEIWNEPNAADFLGIKSDIPKYSDILREAYLEIKKVNQNAVVLSGGLMPSGDETDGSTSPSTFMKTLYALGSNQYFDIVALHPYTYPASPDYQAGWNGWQQMVLIRQLMITKGDSNKKIWVTEYGASTGGPGNVREINQFNFAYDSDYMSETAQKEMVQQVLTLYNQNADWMGPFFWYSLKDNGASRDTPENFFGLLRFDGSKKPAYNVFRNAILSSQQ